MVYTKNTWVDDDPTKPLSAGRLNNLETQYDQAIADATTLGATTYTKLSDVYVWSQPNNLSGAGPGGVSIDATAAANVPRNTTAKISEGYIAIGRSALGLATRARNCIAIGPGALGVGNPGFGNIAIGTFALANVQGQDEFAASVPGTRNTAIGSLAGLFVSTGYYNTFMGRDSGQTTTTGFYNTGIGYRSLTSGYAPVGLDGTIINQYPSTAFANAALGFNAGAMLVGSNNVVVGSSAASNLRNSATNVIIGQYAANNLGINTSENSLLMNRVNLTGTYSQSGTVMTVSITANGAVAGNKVMLTFTSGYSTVTGEGQWMTVSSVIDANTFTVTPPTDQASSGNVTLTVVETATSSTVVGANTIVGQNAMSSAQTSSGNQVVIGESAGIQSTGGNNTLIGTRSGYNLTDGTSNVFLGQNAGRTLISGANNSSSSNSVAVGTGTQVSGDNQVQLGNSSTTTYVYGTVQNRSDARDKADIADTELGLQFVNKLRPVQYRWDMREDYATYDEDGNATGLAERDGSKKRNRFHQGLIAQEVQAVVEELGTDFGGLQDHSKSGGVDVLSIGYDEMIAPLIKAVQELSAEVEKLKAELASK